MESSFAFYRLCSETNVNGFGTLNEYHYEVFKIVVIMIFIIQTHCHLLQLLSYKRTATNFLSAMHSKAADWWKPCDLH